ncbi:ribonuclease H-like domain-containing protein [Tanacetum coccineum]
MTEKFQMGEMDGHSQGRIRERLSKRWMKQKRSGKPYKTRFGGLEKGYDYSKQWGSSRGAHGAEVTTEDAKSSSFILRSLPHHGPDLAMTMRLKPEGYTFNYLMICIITLEYFDRKSKVPSKTSSSAQNVAFVSQSKSSSNKVKSGFTGAYSTCTPSTSSTNIPEKEVLAGFADEIAMIAIRMKKFYKKTRRRVRVDGKTPVGFDKKKLECFNCHNTGYFARECTVKGTNDGKKKRDSFLSHQESGNAREESDGLLYIDDGIKQRVVNTGNGVAKPVWTNANRVNHANKFVPRSVQLNAGRPNINSVRPNINTGRTNVNPVRPRVNTGSSNVNTVRSRQPCIAPLTGVNTPGSDENRLKLYDLMYIIVNTIYLYLCKNQANPHAGTSEVTNSAGTSQTPYSNASEEKDEDVELIVVPYTQMCGILRKKLESRKSFHKFKKEENLTETSTREKGSSTDT